MDLNQFKNLDPENIGNWPLLVRAVIVIGCCIGVLFAGYYFHISTLQQQLVRAEQEEVKKRQEFENKQRLAANLAAYEQQMREMEETFDTMRRQLPRQTEVADLLVDITQTGLSSGLEFELFEPRSEVPKGFYAELPININISGQYHNFGEFVSGVAALPRIVTLHNLSISQVGSGGELSFSAVAKTYRYFETEEK
ncbi:pilus assembly protein PilO [Ectothiorhodospiraceae bacterium BW-2]|nr:pilus assembly protein PilO [Ectothiorhodospiraceae bacterium BW-2]